VSRTPVGWLSRVGAFLQFPLWPNEAIVDRVADAGGPAQSGRNGSSNSLFWPNEALVDAITRTPVVRLSRVGAVRPIPRFGQTKPLRNDGGPGVTFRNRGIKNGPSEIAARDVPTFIEPPNGVAPSFGRHRDPPFVAARVTHPAWAGRAPAAWAAGSATAWRMAVRVLRPFRSSPAHAILRWNRRVTRIIQHLRH
jgi:hypothetical protein